MTEVDYNRLISQLQNIRPKWTYTNREDGYDDAVLSSISMVRGRFKGQWNNSAKQDDKLLSHCMESLRFKYKQHITNDKYDQGYRVGLEKVASVLEYTRRRNNENGTC